MNLKKKFPSKSLIYSCINKNILSRFGRKYILIMQKTRIDTKVKTLAQLEPNIWGGG